MMRLGYFGIGAYNSIDRANRDGDFMDKQKKTLLCMYVDDFCGIKKESFNFYIERRYMIKEGKIGRKSDEEIEDFPKNFWGINGSNSNVSAVTLLIGENGAGKTTLMRLLIKWLCQLSVGNIPQEKGALVISVDGEDKLIAFDGGKPWTIGINKNDRIVCIEDKDKIEKLLSDIRLAYYTDTMTDLELNDTLTAEELEFLQDDSLLTRLSNSMKNRYTVESIKDCIKREDFERQMKLFLRSMENPNIMPKFPLRYMKLTALKAGDEKSFKDVIDGNSKLIGEAIDFWNNVFARDAINNNLPDIARALLWGVFSGTIISLIRWERTLPNLGKRIVTEQVRSSLRAYIRYDYYDWNTAFVRFFDNMFSDCEKEFRVVRHYEEFGTVWNKQIKDNINRFLVILKNIENGEFLEKWMLSENSQNVWEFKLEYFNENNKNILKEWRSLWECYLAVEQLMPQCRFDWKYASSGGKNQSNIYINLFNVVDEYSGTGINQLWLLLDEPDNTFHPDWERGIIRNLLKTCSVFNINFQLLISTHSPIMLSDVPKQAAILLKTDQKKVKDEKEEKGRRIKIKQQIFPKTSPFGQQIYTLFNDSFFMKNGIIGAFADLKIVKVYKGLYDIEKLLSKRKLAQDDNKVKGVERDLKEYECIIKLIEEPLLHGHLSQSYKLCMQRIKGLR